MGKLDFELVIGEPVTAAAPNKNGDSSSFCPVCRPWRPLRKPRRSWRRTRLSRFPFPRRRRIPVRALLPIRRLECRPRRRPLPRRPLSPIPVWATQQSSGHRRHRPDTRRKCTPQWECPIHRLLPARISLCAPRWVPMQYPYPQMPMNYPGMYPQMGPPMGMYPPAAPTYAPPASQPAGLPEPEPENEDTGSAILNVRLPDPKTTVPKCLRLRRLRRPLRHHKPPRRLPERRIRWGLRQNPKSKNRHHRLNRLKGRPTS